MIAPYTVILASLLTVMTVVQGVTAESHTVTFTNNCDNGTPTLIDSRGNVLSTGGDFTSDGPLIAIAFLQTDSCGEDCALIETTLQNPPAPESFGSITDISLVPPHRFSVATGFKYFNGCDGQGADCNDPNCPTAIHDPNDLHAQVLCQADDVGLNIIFCG